MTGITTQGSRIEDRLAIALRNVGIRMQARARGAVSFEGRAWVVDECLDLDFVAQCWTSENNYHDSGVGG